MFDFNFKNFNFKNFSFKKKLQDNKSDQTKNNQNFVTTEAKQTSDSVKNNQLEEDIFAEASKEDQEGQQLKIENVATNANLAPATEPKQETITPTISVEAPVLPPPTIDIAANQIVEPSENSASVNRFDDQEAASHNHKPIHPNNHDPAIWLPQLIEVLKEIAKEEIATKEVVAKEEIV